MPRGIGVEFMRLTRHAFLAVPAERIGKPEPSLTELPATIGEAVALPARAAIASKAREFLALATERTSLRSFTAEPLALDEIAFLLWCTQGVKEVPRGMLTLRTVPSAGSRHALETLVLANRVRDLAPGPYHYDPLEHRLLSLPGPPDLVERLVEACYGQEFLAQSAAAFLWVAMPQRMTWRYGERGYRYLHLDAGHVAQNLCLAAESIGAGACPVAAFDDQAVNALLGLDGELAFLIYLAAVGKRVPSGAGPRPDRPAPPAPGGGSSRHA
jgi:SagB-type dehydrogenase family enzyme